jgi:hypothetical protein
MKLGTKRESVAAAIVLAGAAIAIGRMVTGCALFTPANIHKAESIAADTMLCLVQNQNLSDEAALLICGVSEVEKELVLAQLHAMRAESAKQAHAAAMIAAHEAAGECVKGDGGAK